MLDVRREGDLHFASVAHTDGRRPVVEGSQMLGQAIVAASRHSPGRRIVSASMLFLRGADAARPLHFMLPEVLTSGRTFTALGVQVHQAGRCCAAGTILLDATAADVISHAVEAPGVSGPYQCEPYDMGLTGRVHQGGRRRPTPMTPAAAERAPRARRLGAVPRGPSTTRHSMSGYWPSSPGTCRSVPRLQAAPGRRGQSSGPPDLVDGHQRHHAVAAPRGPDLVEWMLYHHHSTSGHSAA